MVPKKDGSLRVVKDFRELNANSLDDRCFMKDINEFIGNIGRSGSTIFTTLDLTSGFWQISLDEASRDLTAIAMDCQPNESPLMPSKFLMSGGIGGNILLHKFKGRFEK
jgi:hypothetical protein